MQLQYHQATYDLLTKNPLFVDRYVREIEDEATLILTSYGDAEQWDKEKQELINWKKRALAWTKYELYQRPVTFAQQNVQQLNQIEVEFGIKLPASVREWYSLDIAPAVMGIRARGYTDISSLKPDEQNNWYFLFDEYFEQGGDHLFFKGDGGDDPPVIAYSNDDYVVEDTFSFFIYCHFWDWYAKHVNNYVFSIPYFPRLIPGLENSPTRHIPLAYLRANFSELASKQQIRFYDDTCAMWVSLLAELDEDNSINQVQDEVVGGLFTAKSLTALQELVQCLWDENPPVFHMKVYGQDETKHWLSEMRDNQLFKVMATSEQWWTAEMLQSALGLSGVVREILHQLEMGVHAQTVNAHPQNTSDSLTNRYKLP